ncbi:ferrous iron transporter B [bacterium]|nr:ferrous iron transporter B [bacterium]
MAAPSAIPTAVIAVVGAPNCGKTALFNRFTGSRHKVANYPGVTVEHKEGRLKLPSGASALLIDLPGTYSLRARSADEAITRDVLLGEQPGAPKPTAILCVVDANNLRLHLRLVLEAKKLGLPIVVALNMVDIAERRGLKLDVGKLEAELGVPVIETVAVRQLGLDKVKAALEAQILNMPGSAADWSLPDANAIRSLNKHIASILKKVTLKEPEIPTRHGIDRVLLHPVWGILCLLLMLLVMFQSVFAWATPVMDAIDAAMLALAAHAKTLIPETIWNGALQGLVVDGVIAGVGSVVIFLPQIMILYLFILLMESTGYMARAAFLLDRAMGGVGLHGKSFIPLLSGFACAIPAIMATRVIEHPRDRLATIMIIPLMTCSARLPVYTLLIAAFIPERHVYGFINLQGLVMFTLYAVAIVTGLAVAWVFKHFMLGKVTEPFLMELPAYQVPDIQNLLIGLWERAVIFLQRAGTTIFMLMIVIWVTVNYPKPPADAPVSANAMEYSIAGHIGHAMEPVFRPLGFNWQMVVALVPGIAAREVAVGALGTVYAVQDQDETKMEQSLRDRLAANWTLPMALSFLTWYIFAPQCLSTIAIARRELGSRFWTSVMVGYLFALAWLAACAVFQLSTALL